MFDVHKFMVARRRVVAKSIALGPNGPSTTRTFLRVLSSGGVESARLLVISDDAWAAMSIYFADDGDCVIVGATRKTNPKPLRVEHPYNKKIAGSSNHLF